MNVMIEYNSGSIPNVFNREDYPFADDLYGFAASAKFDMGFAEELHEHLHKKVAHFDDAYLPVENRFGPYLVQHLKNVRQELTGFLIDEGYDKKPSEILGLLFGLHDVGKMLQPGRWKITEAKQPRTPEDQIEKPNHTLFAPIVIRKAVQDLGYDLDKLTTAQKNVVDLAIYFGLTHHEHENGLGPRNMPGSQIDPILKAAIAVDGFDGKRKGVSFRTALGADEADHIFSQMTGEKHKGVYHIPTVEKLRAYHMTRYPAAQPTVRGEAPHL